VLAGKGLAKFHGPELGPRITSIEEYSNQLQLATCSYYALTDAGQEFVFRHTEEQLRAGKFLLPGETPWYDQWPVKLLWPALVSVGTTLVTYFIMSAIKGAP
jgi:hypothetical protein